MSPPRKKDTRKKARPDKITTLTVNVLDQIARESGGELSSSDIENLDFSGDWFDLDSLDGLSRVNWRHLLVLDVSNNSLESLDDVLNRFVTLRTISAGNNLITKVSVALPNLKELDLSRNFLNSVPDLSRLGGLEKLLLAANEIKEGYDEFNFVPRLITLDLSQNKMNFTGGQFKEFLDTLGERTTISSLKLDENPFTQFIPNYEVFCIKALPKLQNLNGDIVPKDRQRQIRSDRGFRLDELMTMGKDTRGVKTDLGRSKQLPTIRDLHSYLEKAKSEPTECLNHIKNLALGADRLVSKPEERIYMFKTNSTEELSELRMEIDSFLQEIIIMLEDLPTIRLPLLRIIANLSEITELNFGQKCLSVLQDLLDSGPDISKDIKMVFETIIIPKLQNPDMKQLSKDMLIGVIRLSEAYEVAEKFRSLIPSMESWMKQELDMEEQRLIMADLQSEELDQEIHSLVIALISEAAKDPDNVELMMKRQLPLLACKLIKAIERETEPAHLFAGQFEAEQVNWYRLQHLLAIIERTSTNNIEAARIFNSEDLHQKLSRDLWEYLMIYKANSYTFTKGSENQVIEMFQYALVSGYINALTGMCGIDRTIQFLNSEAVQVREELLAISIMPQTDPVLLTAII